MRMHIYRNRKTGIVASHVIRGAAIFHLFCFGYSQDLQLEDVNIQPHVSAQINY